MTVGKNQALARVSRTHMYPVIGFAKLKNSKKRDSLGSGWVAGGARGSRSHSGESWKLLCMYTLLKVVSRFNVLFMSVMGFQFL